MLLEYLKNYAEDKLAEPSKPKEHFWPSEAESCLRQVVYNWLDTQKDPPRNYNKFFIFDDGNLHHQSILEHIKKLKYAKNPADVTLIAAEFPFVDKERNIKGRIDAVLAINDRYYVMEMKSANRDSFIKHKEDGSAEESHISQLQTYMYYARDIFKFPIDKGIVLYKCKDTSEFCEFLYDYDESIVKNFFEKIKIIEKFLNDKVLPERQYTLKDWQCQYCDYQSICWKDYKLELKKKYEKITDEELTQLLSNYIDVKRRMGELEKNSEELNTKIKDILRAKDISSATIYDYYVELKKTINKNLDKDLLIEKFGKDAVLSCYKEKEVEKLIVKEKHL